MDAARRTRRLIGHSDRIKPTGMRFFKIPCRRQTFGRYSRGRGGLGRNGVGSRRSLASSPVPAAAGQIFGPRKSKKTHKKHS